MEQNEISIFPEQTITYATFGQRLGALILDSLVLLAPNFFIGKYIGGQNIIMEMWHGEFYTSSIVGQSLCIVIGLLYASLQESGPAQATIGKKALGIKVIGIDGGRISLLRAMGRHLAKNISAIIILIGYFMMLWDYRNQTLHDKMAGTLVIKDTVKV